MSKTIKITIALVLIIICTFVLYYFSKGNSDNIQFINQKLIVMPVPKQSIYLGYDFIKKEEPLPDNIINAAKKLYVGDEGLLKKYCRDKGSKITSTCNYVGKENSMAFSMDDSTYAFEKRSNNDIVLYMVTASSLRYPDNVVFTPTSTIQIYSEPRSLINYVPDLGVYQPCKYFLNKYIKVNYLKNKKIDEVIIGSMQKVKVTYYKNGNVESVSTYTKDKLDCKSKFSDYKFYENINMSIPSKVIYYKYLFLNYHKQVLEGLDYTLELQLKDVKYINDETGSDFGMQSPTKKDLFIMDNRNGYKIDYSFQQGFPETMNTIDKESARQLKLQKNSDKEKNNTNITVLKVLSLVFIIIIIYFIIVKIKKDKIRNK